MCPRKTVLKPKQQQQKAIRVRLPKLAVRQIFITTADPSQTPASQTSFSIPEPLLLLDSRHSCQFRLQSVRERSGEGGGWGGGKQKGELYYWGEENELSRNALLQRTNGSSGMSCWGEYLAGISARREDESVHVTCSCFLFNSLSLSLPQSPPPPHPPQFFFFFLIFLPRFLPFYAPLCVKINDKPLKNISLEACLPRQTQTGLTFGCSVPSTESLPVRFANRIPPIRLHGDCHSTEAPGGSSATLQPHCHTDSTPTASANRKVIAATDPQ